MSSGEIAVIVLVIVVAVVLAAAVLYAMRRRGLRQRFGPEYDRVVAEKDSRRDAERELRDRERQHAQLELRPLSEESRERYATGWSDIQAQFVDDPAAAVGAADELVTQLVAERGYPTNDYDEQVAHLSVEHARTLGHYRDAHDINLSNQRGEASTEQLRQALVHYRVLFADLLGDGRLGRPEERADVASPTAAATDTSTLDRTDVDHADVDRTDASRHAADATEPTDLDTDEPTPDGRTGDERTDTTHNADHR